MKKIIYISGIVIGLIIVILILLPSPPLECSDGTYYNHCSDSKPLYCYNNTLIENASYCGCPFEFMQEEEGCISIYKIKQKNVSLEYFFEGETNYIPLTLYGGLNDYLAELSSDALIVFNDYDDNKEYSWEGIVFENLNEVKQKEGIYSLVMKIRKITNNSDDQARIAISLVQHLPYDNIAVNNDLIEFRYPYETLYDKLGVCGDKSILLVALLKDLGFGAATLEYELHRAVGISCSDAYDYLDSGYCFVESNSPTIITDNESNYTTGEYLDRLPFPDEIIVTSEGFVFDASEEFKDSKRVNDLLIEIEEQEIIKLDYEMRLEDYGDPVIHSRWEKYSKLYKEYCDFYEEYELLFDERDKIYNKYFYYEG